MKKVFLFLVVIHGLIHLMGFLKAFGLAEISELTLHISQPSGLLWLFAAVLFLATLVLLYFKKEWWWTPASAAVIVSQFLIIISWQDAKFGTIANIFILILIIAGFGKGNLNTGTFYK